MPGPITWIERVIGGKTLLAPLKAIRYNLSWQSIYQAGLVYGVNGNGLYPSGSAVNQYKTIHMLGKKYIVRLFKGIVGNGTSGTNWGSDTTPTHNSEWNNFWYPITSVFTPSYTGPKYGSYTNADMGFISGNGGWSWVQEIDINLQTSRLERGLSINNVYTVLGLNATNATNATGISTFLGWRPVLELVP